MESFDIYLLHVYGLAIITLLIKAKTIWPIYRFFQVLTVALFGYAIGVALSSDVKTIEILIKGIPAFFVLLALIQSEILILLKVLGIKKNVLLVNTLEDNVKIELIKSVDYLSANNIGALITFEKNMPLDEYIRGAYPIKAPLNSELLSTIFFPNTPLHDGAVIIRRNEIICAGAYYLPTERIDIPKQLGSRHRAAIGISEATDSLTVVVSEQTGAISIAFDGYLDQDISKESLLLYLEKHLQA